MSRHLAWVSFVVLCVTAVAACGDNNACSLGPFADGDPTGHAHPLGASATEARAGRLVAADLPAVPSDLLTWKAGDFVLANDRVALVIEDAGASDLYDPWGGRPVGLAQMIGGKMIRPNNFGEVFILTGRSTVVTEEVTVLNDGSDGKAAVIRARGKLHPLPFFEAIISIVYKDTFTDVEAAIDYSLEPGADHVDITMNYAAPRTAPTEVPSTLHALMYTKRTPLFQPNLGFDESLNQAPFIALVDDQATSWAYLPGTGTLGSALATSGFLGAFADGYTIPACERFARLHARIAIGEGLDGAIVAAQTVLGQELREITGTVKAGAAMVPFAHVHARDAAGNYLGRGTTNEYGRYTLHVPPDADVTLDAYVRGAAIATLHAGTGAGPFDVSLPATGTITVSISEGAMPSPGRIQVLPAMGTELPKPLANWGEAPVSDGRLHVAYSIIGSTTLQVPPGTWEVIVSRGYEYEVERQTVTVAAGGTATVDAALEHVVATPATQCADMHIHTWRSNDSGDVATEKVRQAIADGLELPVRSDHEWVGDFAAELANVGGEAYAKGFASVELTSFQLWGHMGVFPLVPQPDQPNAGAPKWQTFPTAEDPGAPFETLSPKAVFDTVRARPEAPVIIINHPRSPTDYFGYVGFDPATGIVADNADWDTQFTVVEVFNDSGWLANREGTVRDWFSLLAGGRNVFAVGSSDSHGIATSPVGYPRTCFALGTDRPSDVTANEVRDAMAAGHSVVSGGIYVSAKLGLAGPGDSTTGAGSPQLVDVAVQAARWVDVDAIDVVVDGETVDTIQIMPGDADAANPVVRWHGQIPVAVRATGGFVVFAAYGDAPLEPVHPGRIPFGVTNPIFVTP